ncbi:MAG TPA: MoaD/ThiS family protein [Xanthomonadales bacterium]|nr:MoaD/ThiS family protein [Xanthomonadales bacterium]
MKQLTVHWFAAYREATGVASEPVQTDAHTAAELFDEMLSKHPALSAYHRALVAINDEMADWTSPLHDGDRVLFFPPVAGG